MRNRINRVYTGEFSIIPKGGHKEMFCVELTPQWLNRRLNSVWVAVLLFTTLLNPLGCNKSEDQSHAGQKPPCD